MSTKTDPTASLSSEEREALERRDFLRVPAGCVVGYRFIGAEGLQGKTSGMMHNVSTGGVLISLSENPQPGQIMAMSFRFPGSEELVIALGEVRWSCRSGEDYQAGVEFMWMGWESSATQESVREFVTAKLDDSGAGSGPEPEPE